MIRAYIAGGLLAAFLACGWYYGHTRYRAGAESVRAELRVASEQAQEAARIMSRDRVATAERIDRAAVSKIRLAQRAADDRRTVGDGLRAAIDRQPAAGADAAECRAERARASLLAGLLRESVGLVDEGASIADGAVILVDGMREREAAK